MIKRIMMEFMEDGSVKTLVAMITIKITVINRKKLSKVIILKNYHKKPMISAIWGFQEPEFTKQ